MFSTAKCGHCGKVGTKIETIEPDGAAYKQTAICCKWCSAILGVTGFLDTGTLIKNLDADVSALKKQAAQIDRNVQQIAYALQQRR